MRSPILLLTRMNAAETSASSAIAACTPLTSASRSSTTADIETFISDVSTTRTNIAIASRSDSRGFSPMPLGRLGDLLAVVLVLRRLGDERRLEAALDRLLGHDALLDVAPR